MNKKILITLIIAVIFIVVTFIIGETFSHFFDKEVIGGNIFRVESPE